MKDFFTTRRQLVGAAGATIALAACSGQAGKTSTGASGDNALPECFEAARSGNGATGTWPNFGTQPTTKGPVGKFDPKYVTLVWFESDVSWDLTSTHASFVITPGTDLDKFAADTFAKMHGLGKKPKFSKIKDSPLQQYQGKDNDDLKKLGAASQHALYFYFSSDKIETLEQFELDDKGEIKKDAQGKPIKRKQIFAFSVFRADGQLALPNDTFFDGGEVAKDARLKGPLFKLNNYFQTKEGTPIDVNDPKMTRIYSLNIYIQIRNSNGNPMVISIDPDTGNGYGYNP